MPPKPLKKASTVAAVTRKATTKDAANPKSPVKAGGESGLSNKSSKTSQSLAKSTNMRKTNGSSTGFGMKNIKDIIDNPVGLDEVMEFKSPAELTMDYVNESKQTSTIVCKIIQDLLDRQHEDSVVKYVKKVGKRYCAKTAIDQTLLSMLTTSNYGDKHIEHTQNWYNYEAEQEEPVAPQDTQMGLKIKQRLFNTIDYTLLDADLDLESSQFRHQRSRKRRASRISLMSKNKESDTIKRNSRTSIRASTMYVFNKDVPDLGSPSNQKAMSLNRDRSLKKTVTIADDQVSARSKRNATYTSVGKTSVIGGRLVTEESLPHEVPLERDSPCDADLEYQKRTSELKNYLRKKTIHAAIFNRTRFDLGMAEGTNTVKRGDKDPLADGELTCDFQGKPLQIKKIAAFDRRLFQSPKVAVSKQVASVTRDPHEIAEILGKNAQETLMTGSGFASGVDGLNLTKGLDSTFYSKQSGFEGLGLNATFGGTDKTMGSALAASFLKSKISLKMDGTSTDGFRKTTNTSAAMKKYKAKRRQNDDDDDFVRVDGDSDGSDKGGLKRYTPMEQRQPKVVFFQDPNMVDEYKKIKEMQVERQRKDSRHQTIDVKLSIESLQEELKVRRKASRRSKDCYSLVQEDLSHNPFMTKILKSSNFTPSSGVIHKDNVELQNSPSVSGGIYKSPRPGIMSKAEFELRTSLTVLKQFGPETGKRNKRSKVTQSMEIKPQKTGFSSAGMSFSQYSESRPGSAHRKLPKIKVFNKASINDLIASIQDVKSNRKIIQQVGPSPGAFSLAATRRKLRQSPSNEISFKRVGIKQSIVSPRNASKNRHRLLNLSLDSLVDSDMADDTSQITIEEGGQERIIDGIQIVDPKNRYKHPKSKLHDSDMGPFLTAALVQDSSIQRLPNITLKGDKSNNQVFYQSQRELYLQGATPTGVSRQTASGISNHLMKNQIAVPGSLLDKSANIKNILRQSKVRKDTAKNSLQSSQMFNQSGII